jgi:hypothetical protein
MSARNIIAPILRNSLKYNIEDFYKNVSSKSKIGYNRSRLSVTLHEHLSTFHCCWQNSIAKYRCLLLKWYQGFRVGEGVQTLRESATCTACLLPADETTAAILNVMKICETEKAQFPNNTPAYAFNYFPVNL